MGDQVLMDLTQAYSVLLPPRRGPVRLLLLLLRGEGGLLPLPGVTPENDETQHASAASATPAPSADRGFIWREGGSHSQESSHALSATLGGAL